MSYFRFGIKEEKKITCPKQGNKSFFLFNQSMLIKSNVWNSNCSILYAFRSLSNFWVEKTLLTSLRFENDSGRSLRLLFLRSSDFTEVILPMPSGKYVNPLLLRVRESGFFFKAETSMRFAADSTIFVYVLICVTWFCSIDWPHWRSVLQRKVNSTPYLYT